MQSVSTYYKYNVLPAAQRTVWCRSHRASWSKAARPAIVIRKEVDNSSVRGTLPLPLSLSFFYAWKRVFFISSFTREGGKIHKSQGCKCEVPFWPIEVSSRERMRQFDLEELVPIETKTSMGRNISVNHVLVRTEWMDDFTVWGVDWGHTVRGWIGARKVQLSLKPRSRLPSLFDSFKHMEQRLH